MAVDFHHESVIYGVLCRKGKVELDLVGFSGVVSESILAFEVHSVGAVPEEAFLSMIEQKIDVEPAEIQRQSNRTFDLVVANDNSPVVLFGDCRDLASFVAGGRWTLFLRSSPR